MSALLPGDVARVVKVIISSEYACVNLHEQGSVLIQYKRSPTHYRAVHRLQWMYEDNQEIYLKWSTKGYVSFIAQPYHD